MAEITTDAKRPDFVTALMGDQWLEIEWRKAIGGKAVALRENDGGGGAGRGGRYAASLNDRQRIGNARGAPQAVVKVISGGGVSDRGELTAQLKYLSRDGDLELEQADGDIRGLVETRDEIGILPPRGPMTGNRLPSRINALPGQRQIPSTCWSAFPRGPMPNAPRRRPGPLRIGFATLEITGTNGAMSGRGMRTGRIRICIWSSTGAASPGV